MSCPLCERAPELAEGAELATKRSLCIKKRLTGSCPDHGKQKGIHEAAIKGT
jgi:hypothetical protein